MPFLEEADEPPGVLLPDGEASVGASRPYKELARLDPAVAPVDRVLLIIGEMSRPRSSTELASVEVEAIFAFREGLSTVTETVDSWDVVR